MFGLQANVSPVPVRDVYVTDVAILMTMSGRGRQDEMGKINSL